MERETGFFWLKIGESLTKKKLKYLKQYHDLLKTNDYQNLLEECKNAHIFNERSEINADLFLLFVSHIGITKCRSGVSKEKIMSFALGLNEVTSAVPAVASSSAADKEEELPPKGEFCLF